MLLGHLPAVLKRAYPAGDVYLRWLLHRAWQDACHLENYLRCYRLHGGCGFEYTSGGSCGCACIIPPKSRGHLPPVGRDVYLRCFWCLPPVVSPTLGGSKFVYTSGGSCGCACIVPPIDRDIYLRCKKIYHIEPDTARSPIVSARRKGAKVTQSPQRYTEQIETDRRA